MGDSGLRWAAQGAGACFPRIMWGMGGLQVLITCTRQCAALFGQFVQWLSHSRLADANHPVSMWNSTNFGRHMGDYVRSSSGSVAKATDNAKRATYRFHQVPLERFLHAKGLLIGRS